MASHRTRLFQALTAFYDDDLDPPALPAKVRPTVDDDSDPEVGLDQVAIASVTIQPGDLIAGGQLVWSGQVILACQALEPVVTDPDDGTVTSPREDHLEEALGQLLAFLDTVPWLLWQDAQRSTWREAFPAYAVTLTIADPGDAP